MAHRNSAHDFTEAQTPFSVLVFLTLPLSLRVGNLIDLDPDRDTILCEISLYK